MASNPSFYHLLLVALVLLCLLIHVALPDDPLWAPQTPLQPNQCRRRRAKEPQPFTGFLYKPLWKTCEQEAASHHKAPGSPPPIIRFTRGRRICRTPQSEPASAGGGEEPAQRHAVAK